MMDLLEYLNDETADQIAAQLVTQVQKFTDFSKLKTQQEKEMIGNVDFAFDVHAGKSVGEDANTWFSFDLTRDTLPYNYMKALFAREITDEEDAKNVEFLKQVNKLFSEKYVGPVRDVIRSVVIPDSDPRTVPLTRITLLDTEIVDYSAVDSDDKRTVNYIKLPGIAINMQSVTSRIFAVREEFPKMSINDVIIKERRAANPMFDAVMGATLGSKYLWDCHLSLNVDYSMSDEFLAIQKKTDDAMKERAKDRAAARKGTTSSPVKGPKKSIKRLF